MPVDSEIISHVEEQAKREGVSPQLLDFYLKLLRIQTELKKYIGIPQCPPQEAIAERIARGIPLISLVELQLDWVVLRETLEDMVSLFAGYPELFGHIRPGLNQTADRLLTPEIVKAWLEGAELPNAPTGFSAGLWQNILQATLSPVMLTCSNVLLGLVPQERWRRGYCPVCGGTPDLSILDKESGALWLICSRCDARWLFPRLQCPHCGCSDQNALAYYTNDDGLYRLHVCERCHGYLKVIDQRQAKTEILVPLERLLTLNIDEQARRYGYQPGAIQRLTC